MLPSLFPSSSPLLSEAMERKKRGERIIGNVLRIRSRIFLILGTEKRPPEKPETAFEKVKLESGLLDFRDGLEDARSDGVRISLRVWTTVFKVALPVVLGEGVWHANGRSTVGNAPRELVD